MNVGPRDVGVEPHVPELQPVERVAEEKTQYETTEEPVWETAKGVEALRDDGGEGRKKERYLDRRAKGQPETYAVLMTIPLQRFQIADL